MAGNPLVRRPVHDQLREQALSILPKPLETVGADVVHLDE